MLNLYCLIVLIVSFSEIQFGEPATIEINNGHMKKYFSRHLSGVLDSAEGAARDLIFSDDNLDDSRQKLYRQLRQYGVPPDIAQLYVPRGITAGDFATKDSNKPQHSSGGLSEDDEDDEKEKTSTFDPWSIVWYIGSFGGLIAFFLVISCSEWCCLRSRVAETLAASTAGTPSTSAPSRCPRSSPRANRPQSLEISCETPPPSYHLFAPPSYDDSIIFESGGEKRCFDVYVVPVHNMTPFPVSPPPKYCET